MVLNLKQKNYLYGEKDSPRRSITLVCLCWLIGVALQLQQPELWPPVRYQALLVLAVVLAGLQWRDWLRARWWLYAALLGLGFAQTGWRASLQMQDRLPLALEGRPLLVTGKVTGLPQVQGEGTRFQLEVEQAREAGRAAAVPARVVLNWRGSSGVAAGERWQLPVRLRPPHGLRNPWGFDLELWLWQQGIGANGQVVAGSSGAPKRLDEMVWYDAGAWIDRARLQVRERLFSHLAPAQAERSSRLAGVLAALVMGDQAAIERQDWDIFRRTGVAHLMSISGLHVTMFAWLAGGLAAWFWRRSARWGWPLCLYLPAPQAALWCGAVAALCYAWFSGWGVPAQRTVCMLLVVAFLRGGGRQWPWHAIWAVAALAVTLLDPWALLQAGFWLSFVAVAILFITGAPVDEPSDNWRMRVWQSVRAFVHQQWVVLLALTPLAMLMFGQFSLAGVFANMLAVPLVTVLVTPLAMLGVVLPFLWSWAAGLVQQLIQLLEWMASWPWAVHGAALAPLWVGEAGLLGGVLLAARLPGAWRLQGLVWLGPVLLWQADRPAPGEFEILAADIGQGGAVLVRTAGRSLLYDTGPRYSDRGDAGQRVLVPLLAALDERLDRVVLSHADSDHAGGIQSILQAQPGVSLMGSLPPQHSLHTTPGVKPCQAGDQWQWDGVRFEVLHPLPGASVSDDATNASSCVLRIANQRRSVLLVGDIEAEQEAAIMSRAPAASLHADVLLAAHHGSDSSSSAAWLQAVQPRWTLIQHGYRNSYGHPHAAVLQRMLEQHTTIVQTDQCGAARWSSTSNAVTCERELRRHYWQHDVPLHPVRRAGSPDGA